MSSKVRNETGCLLSPLQFNIVFDFLAREIRHKEEIKRKKIGKEIANLSLFANEIILCQTIQLKKLLGIIDSFSKIAGYKINL
jgi:hypothetical protein